MAHRRLARNNEWIAKTRKIAQPVGDEARKASRRHQADAPKSQEESEFRSEGVILALFGNPVVSKGANPTRGLRF